MNNQSPWNKYFVCNVNFYETISENVWSRFLNNVKTIIFVHSLMFAGDFYATLVNKKVSYLGKYKEECSVILFRSF